MNKLTVTKKVFEKNKNEACIVKRERDRKRETRCEKKKQKLVASFAINLCFDVFVCLLFFDGVLIVLSGCYKVASELTSSQPATAILYVNF